MTHEERTIAAKNIRTCLAVLELKQSDLSERLGLSKGACFVGQLLNPDTKRLTANQLVKVADALGVPKILLLSDLEIISRKHVATIDERPRFIL